MGQQRVGPRKVGPRRGAAPNPEKWFPQGGAPQGWGPARVGPRKGGAPKVGRAFHLAFFFPSPTTIFCHSSLSWRSSRGILVVFEAPGP